MVPPIRREIRRLLPGREIGYLGLSMRANLKYFTSSFVVTALGLVAGAVVGWYYRHTGAGLLSTVFIVAVLSVLEISLSFDNAVVNATVLRDMTPVWRHRFLTWGIAIAVFGMRLVFPLVVVSVVASVSPWEAMRLAALEPAEYARILTSAHVALGAFGGAFLGMVCLKYFFDAEKDVHWIVPVEAQLARLGKVEAAALGIMMVALYAFSRLVHAGEAHAFLVAGIFGLVTFIAVDGLGVGAMFVRSLTVMLVERGTLESYRYLEHGAFWAIGALAILMLAGTVVDVPDPVTGLVGAAFVGLSLWSSVRWRRGQPAGPTGSPPPPTR